MVDKRYAVDSPCGIDTENSVDTVCLKLLPEFVPCIVRAHGVFDRTAQMVERSRLLQFFLGFCIICLQSFITYVFPYFTRLERRADAVSVVGQSTVDNARVISAFDRSGTLLDRDVEQFQQRAELAVGRASVIAQA